MNKLNYKECVQLLLRQDDILILSHKNPDGDTVGSCCALCSALRRSGKNAYIYKNSQISDKLKPYAEKYMAPDDFEAKYHVAVDLAAPQLFPEGFEGDVQLCIDHHPTNTGYAQNLFLRADRSSCGEIVLELIKLMPDKLTAEEATLLYIALSTDTGCFQYGNTTARSFSAAAELIHHGADNHRINLEFFRKVSRARIMLEGMVYSRMEYYREGKITVACITRDMMERCGASDNDCDDLAGLAGRVAGSVISITIKETERGGSKVSVRSTPEVSASDICAVFGGGGHAMAAGCRLDCEPERAKEMLLNVIDEVWK